MPPRRSSRLAVWKRDMKLTYSAHMTHLNNLLQESNRLMFEHALYELYCWILSFLAGTDSTTEYRLSVYPQARLIWEGLVSGDDGEYKPTDDEDSQGETTGESSSDGADETSSDGGSDTTNVAVTTSSTVTEAEPESVPKTSPTPRLRRNVRVNIGNSSIATRSAEQRKSRETLHQPRGPVPPDSNDSEDDPDDDDDDNDNDDNEHTDAMSRYPDFLVSLTLPSKPMGLHTLWEIKRLHKNEGWSRESAETKAHSIVVSFKAMQRQIVESAACAFNQYPMHDEVRYVSVVGYYLRFITFKRDCMPPDDFNWKDKSKLQTKKLQEYCTRNEPSPVYLLFTDPETKDYHPVFKQFWDKSLEHALDDLTKAETQDPNAIGMEDLSNRINELILKDDPRQNAP